jgi:TolB protein
MRLRLLILLAVVVPLLAPAATQARRALRVRFVSPRQGKPTARGVLGPRAAAIAVVCVALGAAGCGNSPRRETPPSRSTPAKATKRAPRSTRPIKLSSLRGRLVFSKNDDIWTGNADGSDQRRLTHRKGPEFDPSWSPDGSKITYRDSRRGINDNDEIYVMDADGSHQRNLTHSPDNEWSPAWSPDGSLIAYYSGQLYVMRPDGTHARGLTNVEGEYPAWSPDGKQIAFMSAQPNARGSNPNYDVAVVNRDGSGLHRLTYWPEEDGWPAWSPDGKWIAFNSKHGAEGVDFPLWVMKADGSEKRLIVGSRSAGFPVWSPDGKTIMVSGSASRPRGGDRLLVVRPDGSGLRELPLAGWLPDWRRGQP